MQNFRDAFKYFIHLNNAKISDISKITKIDRSTLYQYQSGKRIPPNMDTVKVIANSLRLSGSDLDKFYDSYMVSVLGEYTYASRKHISQILCHLSDYYPVPVNSNVLVSPKVDLHTVPHHTVIVGENNINNIIETIIYSDDPNDHIRVSEPILHEHTAQTINDAMRQYPNKKITQLIMMENRVQLSPDDAVYNLQLFEHLLPLMLDKSEYSCYYIYGDLNTAGAYMLSSYMVMNNSYVFIYSPRRTTGMLLSDTEDISYYSRLFQETISSGRKLNDKPDVESMINYFENDTFLSGSVIQKGYLFDIGLCISLILDWEKDSVWISLITEDIEEAAYVENKYRAYCEMVQSIVSDGKFWWNCIFTKQGIEYFCDTGILVEIYFFTKEHPLSLSFRIDFLQRWLKQVESGRVVMIDFPQLSGATTVAFTLTPQQAYIEIPAVYGYSAMVDISESSLAYNLYDYFEDCYNNRAIGKDETIAYIERKISEMQQKLSQS